MRNEDLIENQGYVNRGFTEYCDKQVERIGHEIWLWVSVLP